MCVRLNDRVQRELIGLVILLYGLPRNPAASVSESSALRAMVSDESILEWKNPIGQRTQGICLVNRSEEAGV